MKEKLTVSDSKTLFHEQFPFVIPNLYKRVIDEMLVELNLLNHQSEFIRDNYFCVGLTESFRELTIGYEPQEHLIKLFSALCKSTNFEPEEINEISQKTLGSLKNKTSEDIFKQLIKKNSSKVFYSRILILGIYKIISSANDFNKSKEMVKTEIFKKISNELNLPLPRAEKDINLYLGSIKKIEQAKELIKETIMQEKEKRKK